MILNKGKYKLNESLTGELYDDLEFKLGKKYFLYGENGSGKSSFIVNVLIPELVKKRNNQFYIFYASQDFTIQYYVIKSYYKGLKKIKRDLSSIEKVLLFIKDIYISLNEPVYYILDEIDQHTNILDFINSLNNKNKSIILTSHNLSLNNGYEKIFFDIISENETNLHKK